MINKTDFKQLIMSGGVEESAFKSVEKEIQSNNKTLINNFSAIAAGILFILLGLSFFVDSLAVNRNVYCIAFAVTFALFVLSKYVKSDKPAFALILTYVFAALLLALGISIGTYLGPTEVSATYIAFLLAVPQLFTDRPCRMYILIICSVVIFIFGVLHHKDPATWSSDITNAFVFGIISIILTTYSIATRVSGLYMKQRVEFLATSDRLTGLKNRHSYEDFIHGADKLEFDSFYGVFIDANGLHELNDIRGHAARDRMLQDIARILREIFNPDDIYRIGGDEFVVFGTDTDSDVIDYKVASVKKAVEAESYHVAAGVCRQSRENFAIDRMIQEAEREMYSDKADYYSQQGLDRRSR